MSSHRFRPVRGQLPGTNYTGEVPYDQPAARQLAPYICARGHSFAVPLAAEVTPPAGWECRCGAPAAYTGPGPAAASQPTPGRGKGTTTVGDGPGHHWRLLTKRRTPTELEQLLAIRLAQIRDGRP